MYRHWIMNSAAYTIVTQIITEYIALHGSNHKLMIHMLSIEAYDRETNLCLIQ